MLKDEARLLINQAVQKLADARHVALEIGLMTKDNATWRVPLDTPHGLPPTLSQDAYSEALVLLEQQLQAEHKVTALFVTAGPKRIGNKAR